MKELLLLSGIGVLAMLTEIFQVKKWVFPLVLVGLATVIALSITDFQYVLRGGAVGTWYGMMEMDKFALAFNIVTCGIAMLWMMLSEGYFEERNSATDHYALVFFALTGALLMVSFTNLSMLFLGIEILSISMYVLAGSQKRDTRSNEAAFKYFLMGAFASGFLLFGFALVYGITGTFDVKLIGERIGDIYMRNGNLTILTVGVVMILVGMGFKISAAPFHFWAPDVYEGSPTVITAFMATVVKTAAFAAFFRLFSVCFPYLHHSWVDIVTVMLVLTLLIGNISAVMQWDAKRMLAFSSVANAGYMLFTIIATNNGNAYQSLLFYAVSYSLASLGTFGILYVVAGARGGATDVAAFDGLGKTNPLLAGAMTFCLLSLAGIPPLAGFMAKYFVFANAIHDGNIGLVLFAVVMSLVGVYYYFRIIVGMYFHGSANTNPVEGNPLQNLLISIVCGLLLLLGLLPGLLYS